MKYGFIAVVIFAGVCYFAGPRLGVVESDLRAESEPTELSVIRTAAERNGIEYGSDDWYILLAIRKAENGREGLEFGVMNPRANDLDSQAGWCAASIVKNRERWDGTGDFVAFMGRRYCPVGAENDPDGLNRHWVKNVNYWFKKLKGDTE